MKKFTRIAAGITAIVLSLGIVGCSGKTTYPDFIHRTDSGSQEETSEKYVVNVRSAGGLKLDGVRVTAYNSNGVRVRSGISSDGVVNFGLTLGEYTLEVDETTLPDGYYLEEGVTYKTNPDKREEVDISIPSAVITQTAASGKVYAPGEIVNDFTFENYSGTSTYKLSDLLKTKKAVVLNFWYTACSWCTTEFPVLQSAYSSVRSDIEVLGVCITSMGDSNSTIASYVESHRADFNLTFPLGMDRSDLRSKYSVSACPTTVIIDRYGMLAYWDEGAITSSSTWQSLFKRFTSDDYVQSIDGEINGGGDSTDAEREKPDVTMPASAEMAAAASAPGLNASYRADEEDEYSWPWTTGTDPVYGSMITVTNTGKQNSYATLYVDIDLDKDDLLSFDYYVSSEEGGDILYVLLDGQLINGDGWSGETGWTSADVYVADRDKTVELAFIYMKDAGDPDKDEIGEDTAKIKNIRVSEVTADTEALDVIREAASGSVKESKYENYASVALGSDGFYHVGSADGPLLYISLSNITPWSELHTIDNQFEYESGKVYASLYNMTYYKYSETVSDSDGNIASFTVNIGGKDFADPLVAYQHMLSALDEPYQLMPVSPQLKEWAESFVAEYEQEIGNSAHENEWLEFCFYYDHYGKEHEDDVCLRDTDITKGLTVYNSYDVGFRSTPSIGEGVGKTTAEIVYPLSRPNTVYYKFTAPADGVYQIRDYSGGTDAQLEVLTLNDDGRATEHVGFYDGVSDFDADPDESFYSFNTYLVLSEGETIYLGFRIAEQTTGSVTFNIIYHDRVDKLIHASTAGGAWTYDENGVYIYLGINVVCDTTTGKYYHDDGNGNPDRNEPVYINMLYENYFISELDGANYKPLKTLIEANVFSVVDRNAQADMLNYLEQAQSNTGDMYGLVEADTRIVEILNGLVDVYGGAGDNRGWLAFACYMEHYVHDATDAADGGSLAVGWNNIAAGSNASTMTFTAPDAGVYSFGVPEGSTAVYNGTSLEIKDGVAEVTLLKGDAVTITVPAGAESVSVFKTTNINQIDINQTENGGVLYTGNNLVYSYGANGKAVLTFTARYAGEYEIDLSEFPSASVTVDGYDIDLTNGVARVTLAVGQQATVTVSDTGERTVFEITQKTSLNGVNNKGVLKTGQNIIGKYGKDGSAALTYTAPSTTASGASITKDITVDITVKYYQKVTVSVGDEEITLTTTNDEAEASVTLKPGAKVTITVTQSDATYRHTEIELSAK